MSSDNQNISKAVCSQCGKEMRKKTGKFGEFWGCSGYPDCKNTMNADGSAGKKKNDNEYLGMCEQCGKGRIIQRTTKNSGKVFWGCSEFPRCDFATWKDPNKR